MTQVPQKKVLVFTDGACSGNPGPGGYGAILRYNDHEKEVSGGAANTTNNRMELMAVISALKLLKKPCEVVLTTDSQYVKNGITTWLADWKKRGWKTASKKPVANQDLWETLETLTKPHKITWEWVRGHSDHPENERCDELARQALEDFR